VKAFVPRVPGSAQAHDSLVRACLEWLAWHGIEAAAVNQIARRREDGTFHTAGAPVGFPDIVGCLPPSGRMLLIECKSGKSRLRPKQIEAARRWVGAGAVWGVVHAVDELPAVLAEAGFNGRAKRSGT